MRKAQAQHGADEHATRALLAAEIDTSVLRTENGKRVLDEDDIPALLALTEIAILMERRWIKRIAAGDMPSTAREAHYRDHGHPLAHGCCNPGKIKVRFPEGEAVA
jgi:hypothetical protein